MFDKKIQYTANFYKNEIERDFIIEPQTFSDNK